MNDERRFHKRNYVRFMRRNQARVVRMANRPGTACGEGRQFRPIIIYAATPDSGIGQTTNAQRSGTRRGNVFRGDTGR